MLHDRHSEGLDEHAEVILCWIVYFRRLVDMQMCREVSLTMSGRCTSNMCLYVVEMVSESCSCDELQCYNAVPY
jgi:hypothetical protein